MMGAIYYSSSLPDETLPDLISDDYILRKLGHIVGYGLLALSYSYWLGENSGWSWRAWALGILYGFTDEIHQSFVPGRSAKISDVLFFDNIGACIGLLLTELAHRRKLSGK